MLTEAEIETAIDLEEEDEVNWNSLRVDFPLSKAQQTVCLDFEAID